MAFPRAESTNAALSVRVIGIGNAGVHLADRIAMAGLRGVEVIAMNSEIQSLAASVAPRKSTLGQRATRGLGAGGDPEVGHEAAQEAIEDIRFAVEGASVVILICGLGGGTASGAAPVVAEVAKESGAFVIALLTMPFAFEGRRRKSQAEQAEAAIAQHAHAVLRFENDRMADLSSPRSAVGETFAAADQMLAGCVASLIEMLASRGPVPLNLGSVANALRGGPASFFGRGMSDGDNRANEAVERALRSPLLDRGRVLHEATAVVAHIAGPPSLTFVETTTILKEVSKHVSDSAALFFGVSSDPEADGNVRVTLLGSCDGELPARQPLSSEEVRQRPGPTARPAPSTEPLRPAAPEFTPPALEVEPKSPPPANDELLTPRPPGRLFADDEPEPPKAAAPDTQKPQAAPRTAPRPAVSAKTAPRPERPKARQETLQFESAARGRFEKSEPTIVEGEDLDVPTFLRVKKN
ncbi:MAG: cell division protein FtsZ [Terrimicrobiaceae bacterium]